MKNNIKSNSYDINFLSWFVGFVEGDGSFVYRPNQSNFLEISQSVKDIQVLNLIRNTLGFGQIRIRRSKPNIAY